MNKIMTRCNTFLPMFLIGLFIFFTHSEVLASSTTTSSNPAGGGLVIAFAIAYFSRKRQIGGWLLYFYLQLYITLVFTLILAPQILSNLNPKEWDDSFLYVMYVLSVAPVLIIQIIQVISATKLLFRRNEQNVIFLRKLLYILVVTSVITIAIDIVYFSEDPAIFFDAITLVFAIIWSLYFSKAKRIKMVFIDKNWDHTLHSPKKVLTAEDKKRLRKRVLISALVTFVAFFIIMGSSLQNEDKQLDFGIFGIPIFYTVVVSIIAWFIPLRKKKQIKSTETVEEERKP